MSNYSAKIASGITLLSRGDSEWMDKVDFTRLNMNSVKDCVLGQLYGDYDKGLVQVGIAESSSGVYGFTTSDWSGDSMSSLTKAWKDTFLPVEGKIYEAKSIYPSYKHLRIAKVIGLGKTVRIVAEVVFKNDDGEFESAHEDGQFIMRKVSLFYREYKLVDDTPKPGAFLQSSLGTKFFVGQDGKLWNISKPSASWQTHEEVIRDFGKLTAVRTVNGVAFTADYTF